jgi:hypothetical protein
VIGVDRKTLWEMSFLSFPTTAFSRQILTEEDACAAGVGVALTLLSKVALLCLADFKEQREAIGVLTGFGEGKGANRPLCAMEDPLRPFEECGGVIHIEYAQWSIFQFRFLIDPFFTQSMLFGHRIDVVAIEAFASWGFVSMVTKPLGNLPISQSF